MTSRLGDGVHGGRYGTDAAGQRHCAIHVAQFTLEAPVGSSCREGGRAQLLGRLEVAVPSWRRRLSTPM